MTQRFHLPPGGDVPPSVAARRLGLSLAAFEEALHRPIDGLLARCFPAPDPTTGNYDLDAIEARRRSRYPQQFGQPLTLVPRARDVHGVVRDRVRGIHPPAPGPAQMGLLVAVPQARRQAHPDGAARLQARRLRP